MARRSVCAATLVLALALTACGGSSPAPTVAESASPAALPRPDVNAALTAGDAPQNPLLAFGSLWVAAHHARAVVRLSETGDVLARIDTGGDEPGGLAAGAGLLWVTHYGPTHLLVAIDPATNKVVHRYPLPDQSCCTPVVVGRTVWVAAGPDGKAVVALNADTGRIGRRLERSYEPRLVGSQLWVVHEGAWAIVDTRTGAFSATVLPADVQLVPTKPAAGLTWGMRAGNAVGIDAQGAVQTTITGKNGRLAYGDEGGAETSGDTAWITDGTSNLWRIDAGAKNARLVATFPADRALSMAGDGIGGVWVAVFSQARLVHYPG